MRFFFYLVALVLITGAVQASETILRFALIPKQIDVPFFREIEEGCHAQAKKIGSIECIYAGPETSDFRIQDKIISELIDQGVNGIAVSVINSEYLAHHSLKKAKLYGIPVITFDSDLSPDVLSRFPNMRTAYVGTDNREMGRALGHGLLTIKEQGVFSIISGNPTAPNLRERMEGLREVLSKSSWTEFSRSPVYIDDNPARSINVLNFLMRSHVKNPKAINTVIALGAFLQTNYKAYRETLLSYIEENQHGSLTVISADASPHQIRLLEEGLSDLNIGQNTFEMGSSSITLLHKIHRGFPVKEINYTSLKICRPDLMPVCRVIGKDTNAKELYN
jgi:ribose transport system substrate-binding protein